MPKLLRSLLFLWFIAYFAPSAQGQDVQFSQFYAAPLYLNPAMTGATELTRVGTIFRNQWPGLDHSFVSYSAFIDHYIFDYNSGIGLIVNSSRESLANLATDEIGLLYSYRLQLSSSQFLRLGGQVSYINRSAFFNDLVFNSMINLGAQNNALTDELGGLLEDAQHSFFNYSFGALYTDTKHWLGVSTHHVTQPSISFLEDPTEEDLRIARLPLKLSVHGGIRFPLGGDYTNYLTGETFERSISFAFNYKQQDPFNQLDLGTQINLDPLVLGLWYRVFRPKMPCRITRPSSH
ncbi:PorP/SprF family type IX secretion system membrane protein [Nitritalea halalkaliphila]|uniref:PorP/SprF family type IX secretion system membrane protein n=1 Tax=Nitritalea halalkaliphila TaxID=590849 RepID=UPI0003194F7D|nr:PorP/SprF family type IX secretion system membrane protein [Nitritalea halalkaliphila]